jgi:hypothetical protein
VRPVPSFSKMICLTNDLSLSCVFWLMIKPNHILAALTLAGLTSCFKPKACFEGPTEIRLGDEATFNDCSKHSKSFEWLIESHYQENEKHTTKNLSITPTFADEFTVSRSVFFVSVFYKSCSFLI